MSEQPASNKYVVKAFDREHFPALYRCADDASKSAQWWYLCWVRVNLILLAIGAVAGSIALADLTWRQRLQAVSATCFFLAVATTLILTYWRWDRIWYAGRAVAESAKSLTWKFMMGAEPLPHSLSSGEAVEILTKSFQELLAENKHLALPMAERGDGGDQVTDIMMGIRASAVGVKRDVYAAQRVREQQEWYARKARSNERARAIWLCLLIGFQIAAGAAAVLLVVNPMFPWRGSAVFSTLASATIAWGQVRRFQELAQAYSLAAHELSLISARAAHVGTFDQLARFVNDAETAISREHSMWVARRETR